MDDRTHQVLLAALKDGLAEGKEIRLYRSGKLPGLFASRSGVASAAATAAVRDGLLEIVRTEVKSKISIEWVKLTPKGVDYLHANTSVIGVLRELRRELSAARDNAPAILAGIQVEWQKQLARMEESLSRATQRLDALADRVDEALRRADALGPALPNGMARVVPWAGAAVEYLERRADAGGVNGCPLPELFAAVRRRHEDVTLLDFHDGLRRLHDQRAVRLMPYHDSAERLPEPEFALIEGSAVLYYATR